nr:MAG TPA: hypothetical protein [Caudoviricetes sp.]
MLLAHLMTSFLNLFKKLANFLTLFKTSLKIKT